MFEHVGTYFLTTLIRLCVCVCVCVCVRARVHVCMTTCSYVEQRENMGLVP